MTKDNVRYMDTKTMGEGKILVTHTDLDGVGCAVIFMKCYPRGQVYFADYNEVNDIVQDIIKKDSTSDIMITDISVNKELAEELNRRGKVALLDHHDTASWLNEYWWANVDTSKCGTKLMYGIFEQRFHLKDYKDFVELVDNWDRWGEGEGPSGEAIQLQFLFDFLGQVRFCKRMVQSPQITERDQEITDIMLEKYEDYYFDTIDMARLHTQEIDGKTYDLVIGVADQFISLIGNRIIKEFAVEYVMLMDPRHDKGSFRGQGNVHLGELAKKLGGGGHAKAAGFPLGWRAKEFIGDLQDLDEDEN